MAAYEGGVAVKVIIPAITISAIFILWCIVFYQVGKDVGRKEEQLRWIDKSIDNLKKDIKKATNKPQK